jgi:hypothetical protein
MTRNFMLLLMLVSAVNIPAWSDVSTAALRGTIADSTGGVLVGARVTVRNLDTGVSRSTTTNELGVFQLLDLQAGSYQIDASQNQFTTAQLKDVILRVGDQVRIDLKLSPATRPEVVEVTEPVPLTQTETATSSTVVNERAIRDLPTDGRQLQNLALLTPGIDAGWNVSTAANRYGKARENTEGAFSVDGARSRSNDFIFDGMPMNLRQYSVINFEPSNEAVQEFMVARSVPAAEYGRTLGGQVNIVTRAGSDHYRGSVYEFFRNDALDANDPFTKKAGLPRPTVRHNQFGGTFGGPLWKQKHFFFANVELLRNIEAQETHTSFVPTADERAGLIPYQDANGNPQILDLSGQITPLSAKLVSLYPLPNALSSSGNYTTPLPIRVNDYQFHIRTDHHLTSKDAVTVRTSWNLNDQVYVIDRFGGPYIPGFTLPNPERTANGTVGHFHTFSPAVVNEARFGINRYRNPLANGDSRKAADFGFPNGSTANGIPFISVSGGGLASLGGLQWYNRDQNELTVYESDTLSVLRGTHSLKFGGELSRYQFNTRGAYDERGALYFNGQQNNLIPKTDANALANTLTDLLLGLPYQATITTGQFGRGYRDWAWALFAQDSWRLSRRLSLNYGVRYDYSTPWTEVNGKLSNFVPGTGVTSPQTPGWDGLYHSDHTNFAPRLGFAYDVSGAGRTVVRGGFGILYETLLQASTVQQIENNAPFSASAITNSPTPFSQDPNTPNTTLLDLRNSAQPSHSLAAVPLHLHSPYSMQFNLDVQQAIGATWLIEVGYHGTRGVHLPVDYNINQVPLDTLTVAQRAKVAAAIAANQDTTPITDGFRPYPGFNSINLFADVASSSYHSLQLKVEHRFSHGLNLLAAYTFSKSIDDATDFASGDPSEQVLDSYNRRLQRSVSSFDIPHRFTAAFNYVLPAPGMKAVFGGWQLNGIVTVQSGQPFTPYTSQFDPYRGESYNRLGLVGDPARNTPQGFAYNPTAFSVPALGTFGSSGRNIIRGDGFRTADLSLFRNFAIGERMKLQMRLEATNSLNQVNYQGPVTDQNATPGAFVAAAAPRTLQLGAKIQF